MAIICIESRVSISIGHSNVVDNVPLNQIQRRRSMKRCPAPATAAPTTRLKNLKNSVTVCIDQYVVPDQIFCHA